MGGTGGACGREDSERPDACAVYCGAATTGCCKMGTIETAARAPSGKDAGSERRSTGRGSAIVGSSW